MKNLCEFLKLNSKLIHLNLSYTGLSKIMLMQLGPALRRSKSMLSLHLNGNPGIDEDLKKHLHERVHCMPYFKQGKIEELGKQTLAKFQSGLEYGTALKNSMKLKETKLQQKTKDHGTFRIEKDKDSKSILGFNRFLGHREVMPSSG